jgi:hypothetical protein
MSRPRPLLTAKRAEANLERNAMTTVPQPTDIRCNLQFAENPTPAPAVVSAEVSAASSAAASAADNVSRGDRVTVAMLLAFFAVLGFVTLCDLLSTLFRR